ncbi:MAG: enoyl-CoA hydratase [Rickettsiales bacterium]|nr:enoyl-CoA hydratase [Rickettsiales bacterium]
MSNYKRIRYEVRGRVAEITMIREPVNAIDMLLAQEVVDAYTRVRHDPEVRAVILTSDCKAAFSAGMDLKMIRGKSGVDLRNFLEVLYFGMHDAQYRLAKPSIAAITAPARAAGVTLAVSCDMVVAADDIDLSYPEIDVGVIPAMHYVHLPRQIGRHKAFELLFSGKPIAAKEAYERGLLNYAVPRDQVLEKARELAQDMAKKSPTVMRIGRDSFMRANDNEYRRTIENVVDTICHIIDTEDAQEGIEAFVEKRKPDWS